ncbi:MAG: phosphopantetheine-binding protein [Paracoccaceae bacterium]|nr:phosphopantetheine-binding protein [Paracoccaceae bacterium]
MSLESTVIFDKIRDILKLHTTIDIPITRDIRIGADLAIDSVEMFDLVMEIEDTYDISFPIEEASAIDTVGSLVDAISRLTDV